MMCKVGIAGSPEICWNPELREMIQKAATKIGIFSHSAVNDDTLRDIQRTIGKDTLNDMEELACEAEPIKLAKREAEASLTTQGEPGDENESGDSHASKFDVISLSIDEKRHAVSMSAIGERCRPILGLRAAVSGTFVFASDLLSIRTLKRLISLRFVGMKE